MISATEAWQALMLSALVTSRATVLMPMSAISERTEVLRAVAMTCKPGGSS